MCTNRSSAGDARPNHDIHIRCLRPGTDRLKTREEGVYAFRGSVQCRQECVERSVPNRSLAQSGAELCSPDRELPCIGRKAGSTIAQIMLKRCANAVRRRDLPSCLDETMHIRRAYNWSPYCSTARGRIARRDGAKEQNSEQARERGPRSHHPSQVRVGQAERSRTHPITADPKTSIPTAASHPQGNQFQTGRSIIATDG